MEERYKELLNLFGRSGLNAMFPNDFEAYMLAFELVDSLGSTIDFFSLPIMPNNISITEPEITNIKKTAGGVISLKSDSFIPKSINIVGNFGRNLKVLLRDKVVDFKSFTSNLNINNSDFQGSVVKTGFGATKVFQSILNGSKSIDNYGEPVKLFMYNFAFSESYVVEVIDKTFSQSVESSNSIWNYNISLKAVATLESVIQDTGSLISSVSTSTIQGGINVLASRISSIL